MFFEFSSFYILDIKLELNSNHYECTILEFDVDEDDNNLFPFKKVIKDKDKQNEEIFKIMNYCYIHGKPPPSDDTDDDNDDNDDNGDNNNNDNPYNMILAQNIQLSSKYITEEIIKETKKEYSLQTPFIMKTIKEPAVSYFLSVGKVNNNYPFLQSIFDSYNRDRIIAKLNNKIQPTVIKWIKV